MTTSSSDTRGITRRSFITATATAGAGLLLRIHIRSAQAADVAGTIALPEFEPSPLLRIGTDGIVTVFAPKAEMGQGVYTALPMLIAEELDAEWERLRIEQSPARPPFDTATGGSDSVASSFLPLRQAGATARAMLVAAAAAGWQVPANECTTVPGAVVHAASGRRVAYGDLATKAAALPVPDVKTLTLKAPEHFRIVGTPVVRRDLTAKCDGSAVFGIDVHVPNMLVASVARCPVFDGRLGSVDDARALAVPGVRRVVRLDARRQNGLPARVAVVADTTWQAMKGRRALSLQWEGGSTTESSARVLAAAHAAMATNGDVAFSHGDVASAKAGAARLVDATYEMPFLAHATMEPMNCTAHVTDSSAELWIPSQFGHGMRAQVARFLNLPEDSVTVHVTYLGGGFGRRYYGDFVIDAVEIARAVGQPVKVVWSREEDVQHDLYRPASVQRLQAALDERGRPITWENRAAGPANDAYWRPTMQHPGASDYPSELPYDIPNQFADFHYIGSPIPVGAWRAVRHTQNTFVIESFVDELAHAAGSDPIEYRLSLLHNDPRAQHVLQVVRDAAKWGTPLGKNRGRGVAFMNYGGTLVGHVAEVLVGSNGDVSVTRVTCAFDCGQIVNPDTVRAQVESASAWAMSAALWGTITIDGGRTVQSNFHDYRVARMRDMPIVDVHLVVNHEEPSGAGEPAVPGVAPAIANAVFAATGKRVRTLPLGGMKA